MDLRQLVVRPLIFLTIALGFVSCSKTETLYPVQGKVLYKGQPLKGATVTFFPTVSSDEETAWPIGVTGEDGTFALQTSDSDGAAPGQYQVAIICMEPVKGSLKGMSMEAAEEMDKLQGVYADPKTSKLTAEVKPESNQLEPFQLP